MKSLFAALALNFVLLAGVHADPIDIRIPQVDPNLLFVRVETTEHVYLMGGVAYHFFAKGEEDAVLYCQRGRSFLKIASEGMLGTAYKIDSYDRCIQAGSAIESATASGQAVKISVSMKTEAVVGIDYL